MAIKYTMKDLSIIVCQCDIEWENPLGNCSKIEAMLDSAIRDVEEGGGGNSAQSVDLVILPEFFSMGFTMSRDAAISERGSTLKWMREFAASRGVALYGSVPTVDTDSGRMYNRGYFVYPDGLVVKYDKKHLFRMGGESESYSAGAERVVVDYLGWKICLNICYDLRFPVWSRSAELEYDLLINVASWPASRIGVTEHLIKARAIENISYAVFCNRVGNDPSNHYNGLSRVVSPRGEDILLLSEDKEDVANVVLKYEPLRGLREKFPVWKDGDRFELK